MSAEEPKVMFAAPWGRSLKIVSLLVAVLMIGLVVFGLLNSKLTLLAKLPLLILPVLLVVGTAAFMVLGYQIGNGILIIRRPGWTTRVSLANLQSVVSTPNAMSSSIRLFGNGGMFSFTGVFWNRTLGRYRAYVTDLQRTVVLKMADRTIVISPEAPDRFVEELRKRSSLAI